MLIYVFADPIVVGSNVSMAGRRTHMPDELIVILGAEVCMLVFTMTMTLRARRMDVLSGRFFERPVVSPAGNRHSPQRVRRHAYDLLRLTRTWIDVDRIDRSDFSKWRGLARSLRSSFQTKLRSTARSRRPPPSVTGTPGRQTAFPEAGRRADARGLTASAPSARALEALSLRLEEVQRSLNARPA